MIDPKFKVGQILFTIEDGQFVEGNVNEIRITITANGEMFNYLFVRMFGGGKAYYHMLLPESRVFESKEAIIEKLKILL